MIDVVTSLLSVVVLCVCMVARPQRARCPSSWHHEGVARDGTYHCVPSLVGDGWDAPQPPGRIGGEIYCTGGTVPIVEDERTVGCQRGRYQW